MQIIKQQANTLTFKNFYNQDNAINTLNKINTNINKIILDNVGIKIMKIILTFFEEADIKQVIINYHWNYIMMTPQLVCYDKNQWKTLQQLANWHREWNQLFSQLYSITKITLNIYCTWMDDQFCRQLLEGIAKLPNISQVQCKFSSKIKNTEALLRAFSQAKIFPNFEYVFEQIK